MDQHISQLSYSPGTSLVYCILGWRLHQERECETPFVPVDSFSWRPRGPSEYQAQKFSTRVPCCTRVIPLSFPPNLSKLVRFKNSAILSMFQYQQVAYNSPIRTADLYPSSAHLCPSYTGVFSLVLFFPTSLLISLRCKSMIFFIASILAFVWRSRLTTDPGTRSTLGSMQPSSLGCSVGPVASWPLFTFVRS
ncbi:hypothetical protein EDC04DRAFT_170936 [Pisolithus marmoratus]|nr:hypothetical protein EDC04DRAFT_170936 [Pisolithus marmoratus]